MPRSISRSEHARRHGPTAGDQIRLGDTDLWIRVERDLTEPADQALWGYAKNLRSRMTQQDRATGESELDAVIASAVIVDPRLGVLKADLGIKDGRIAGIGRAGNPDITDGVDLTIGPGTWPIPCHGLIATPGGIDTHVHLLSPRLVPVALSAGITTLITAGLRRTGVAHAPHAGSVRTAAGQRRAAGQRARRPPRSAGPADRGRLGGSEDPRGLGRLSRDRRCHAGRRRGARHRGLPAHRRAQRIDRARGDGRRDRRPHDPRLSRGGRGRRPHPRPARPGARGEHPVFLHHPGTPVGTGRRRRARRHDPHRARGQPADPRGRRRRAGADPRHHARGRGAAARPRRHLDHQLRLPGHGSHRRDDPAHVAARRRDEALARERARRRMAR